MVAAMHRPTRLKMTDLNAQLMCVLCGGYFIDATTIIECLHSFCKSCIVRYLETSKYCPVCDVQIHKTKPLLSIRSDQTLQEIVYKLVPGLFQNEMRRRREFYAQHPQEAKKLPPSGYSEERGEVDGAQRFVGCADENINFSLEYFCGRDKADNAGEIHGIERRYLRCPAAVTVAHLKKLICAKYNLSSDHTVDIICSNGPLDDDLSLMDISYIYSWRRNGQLRLFFRIYESFKRRKIADESLPPSSSLLSTAVNVSVCEPTKDEIPEIKDTEIASKSVDKVASVQQQLSTPTPPKTANEQAFKQSTNTNTKVAKVTRFGSKECTNVNGKKLVNGNNHNNNNNNNNNHCKDRISIKRGEKHTVTKNITDKLNGLVKESKGHLVNGSGTKT